jgi:hypothetical protein
VKILDTLLSELRRRVLGISPEEIRFTFEDVRGEIRQVRRELGEEIEKLRRELDAVPKRRDEVKGPEIPVAEA